MPGTIKDAGHHAKGKGSTKKRRRLQAASQCPPHPLPPSPLEAARGPRRGGEMLGDPMVEQTTDTPKLPRRKLMGTHPQDHTMGSQHHHGVGRARL